VSLTTQQISGESSGESLRSYRRQRQSRRRVAPD